MIYLRTLLGSNNLDFSISCLKSCIDNCAQETILEVFEDGTLTGKHHEYIISKIPNAAIIYRSERDEDLNKLLQAYPESASFRKHNIFGHKLYDVMLYKPRSFFYIDSDILFYRKFSFPQTGNSPFFMMDAENAYCFSNKEMYALKDKILPRINAGFYYFPVSFFKLEAIENILCNYFKPEMYGHSWAEQSVWGFLARTNQSTCYFNNAQILMASPIIRVNKHLTAIHFSKPYRIKINSVKQKINKLDFNETHLTIGLIPAENHVAFISFLLRKYYNKLLRKLTFIS